MSHHCSLCFQTGHNSSTCIFYPIEELHHYIFGLFYENIRLNTLHNGLSNYQERKDHHYTIQNHLSLSELKIISRKFGLKTSFNRAILAENLINIYTRLAKRLLEEDPTFLQELHERNILLERQTTDLHLRNNIQNIIENLQTNINSLSENNLQSYISQMGIHLHNVALNIPSSMPIAYKIKKNKFNINLLSKISNVISNENNGSDCPICLENKNSSDFITTNCNHQFCKKCIVHYVKTCNLEKKPQCSLCRTSIYSYSMIFENSFDLINNVFQEI